MLDNDTDIVARLDNYLFHYTVKDGLDLGVWIKSYLYAILWRQFKILIHRMIAFTEMIHYRSDGRP